MLRLRNLECGYQGRVIVTVPELEVADREILALVGRSGGGKSTLLATLAGAIPPLSGEILLNGRIADTDLLKRKVARTLQAFPLLHWKTVGGNLKLAARIRGVALESAVETLGRFSAAHLVDRFPKELSGGERARASLAQASVSQPSLLLLDEPLTGLDPIVREDVAKALFDFAHQAGCAVILVTHDLLDATRFANRVIALRPTQDFSMADCIVPTGAKNALETISAGLRGNPKETDFYADI